jgi:basic membrane protein A
MRKLTTLIAASMTAALALSAGMAVMADEPDFTGEGSIAYVVTGLGDMSFNDSGEVGMNTLRAAGYDVKTVETGDDASGYEDTMYDLLDTGYDYVIASSTYKDQIEKVAPEFTDTKFVLFDVNSDTEVASDNILYIYFKQNESSYLGGIVAAGMSKTGAIGAIGGVENPVIKDFITGYVDGALSYNPDIKVSTGWVGDWSNTAKMKEICNTQNSSADVDVFFPIAGGAGTGAFEASTEIDDSWALGVDSDQYAAFIDSNEAFAKVIPTSVTKEVGNTMVSLFKDPSTIEWGTLRAMGVAEDAVGLAENEYYEEVVPQEVRDAVETAKEGIKDGSIVVKSYFDGTEDDYTELIGSVG